MIRISNALFNLILSIPLREVLELSLLYQKRNQGSHMLYRLLKFIFLQCINKNLGPFLTNYKTQILTHCTA